MGRPREEFQFPAGIQNPSDWECLRGLRLRLMRFNSLREFRILLTTPDVVLYTLPKFGFNSLREFRILLTCCWPVLTPQRYRCFNSLREFRILLTLTDWDQFRDNLQGFNSLREFRILLTEYDAKKLGRVLGVSIPCGNSESF